MNHQIFERKLLLGLLQPEHTCYRLVFQTQNAYRGLWALQGCKILDRLKSWGERPLLSDNHSTSFDWMRQGSVKTTRGAPAQVTDWVRRTDLNSTLLQLEL